VEHDFRSPKEQLHTAHKPQEIHINYKFHPLCGNQVNVIGYKKVQDEFHYLVELPDASRIYIPSWMTFPESNQSQLRRIPRIKLKALKDLRRLLNGFLLSLQSETENESGGVINDNLQASLFPEHKGPEVRIPEHARSRIGSELNHQDCRFQDE
jgi:hypothetical protein